MNPEEATAGKFDAKESMETLNEVMEEAFPGNMKAFADQLSQSFPTEVFPPKRDQEMHYGNHIHWARNDEN